MTLELEKEKVQMKFSLHADAAYSPISRFEQIPREDQEDLIAGEAGFYSIDIEAHFNGETLHFVSQGMIMSLDEDARDEEFEAYVTSEGGLVEEVILRVKTWSKEKANTPRWSK